jgi:zinc transporter ZupT
MYDYLLTFLRPVVRRLADPVLREAKEQIRRLLIAVSFAATGVACVVVGLTYFASSAWHALVPAVGTVGADLILGFAYAVVAGGLLFVASRMVR